MADWFEWLAQNWTLIVIPAAVFIASLVVLLWLRRLLLRVLQRWAQNTAWPAYQLVTRNADRIVFLGSILLSIILGTAVSSLPEDWKSPTTRGLWTLFTVVVGVLLMNLSAGLVTYYSIRAKAPARMTTLTANIVRAAIFIALALIALEIWKAPTTPLLVLIVVVVLAAILLLREVVPNFIAGLQIATGEQLKVGDYIRLDSGEEGYVVSATWKNTQLRTADGSTVILPNRRLVQATITNYGHPVKKAKTPFRFYSRTHLTQLAGSEAKNLREMIDILRNVPEAVVYYHTHRFLEEHHYLTPEPSNDFAIWVTNALGEEALGERLAAVDTFTFPNLIAVRDALVSVMEEHLARHPASREAAEGSEFHFLKSVTVIFPTPYVAHDLREFTEILRHISLGSLYYHIFESRLRLGKGLNDFTIWLKENLDEEELGEAIARLDPYSYTLEGLRTSLVALVEKHIQ